MLQLAEKCCVQVPYFYIVVDTQRGCCTL